MRLPIVLLFLLFSISDFLMAQKLTNADYSAYVEKYKFIAIKEMQIYKIPASITLAQGMIESGCGKSVLAIDTKNHFGIKCQKEWTGETYYYDDDMAKECFRKYKSVEESFRDHSIFLTTRKRYAALFELPLNDYKGWAYGLKQAGYATNPDYPAILIRLIEANKLYLLDANYQPTAENSSESQSDGNDNNTESEIHPAKGAAYDANNELNKAISKDKNPVNKEARILFRKNYKMPDPSKFDVKYTTDKGRKVYQNQDVPFIFAKKDDTWYSISKEFKVLTFKLYRQNDLRESDQIAPGQMVYLKTKKRKNPNSNYKVKKGDSLYSISQEKCIKLTLLLRYNKLQPGDEPAPGYVLKLSR